MNPADARGFATELKNRAADGGNSEQQVFGGWLDFPTPKKEHRLNFACLCSRDLTSKKDGKSKKPDRQNTNGRLQIKRL